MEWIKGIRQLRAAKDIFEQLVFEINHGNCPNQDDIPNRIATIQSALEDAKDYFLEEAKPLKMRESLIEFERSSSVLPMHISKTGNPNEPLTEIIICTAISGGNDYVDEMPRRLILHRKLANEKEHVAVYLQEADNEKR